MRVCLFTCRRDAGKAALATRTIPKWWSVAWVVDAPDAGIAAPPGVEVLVEPFQRGLNLNGEGACVGIASVLRREAARFGRVAKMDSDCLLAKTTWLAIGNVAGMPYDGQGGAVYGLAYALSRSASEKALAGILEAVSKGQKLKGEDKELTARAGPSNGLLPLGSFWESRHNGKLPPAKAVAIHCGSTRATGGSVPMVEKEMLRLGDALGLWRR